MRSHKLLGGEFTLHSNPLTINIKQERNGYKRSCYKTQHTTSPFDTQILKHRSDKQGKQSSKDGSYKCLGRNRTCCTWGESVDEVVQRRLENGKEAKSHEYEADTWSYPMNIGGGCPAEDEEACCEEYTADHHWREASFGDGLVVICFKPAGIELVVAGVCWWVEIGWKWIDDLQNVCSAAENCTQEKRKKWKPILMKEISTTSVIWLSSS